MALKTIVAVAILAVVGLPMASSERENMVSASQSAVTAMQAVQALLLSLQSTLAPSSFLCPASTPIEHIQSVQKWEYILVGSGSAGSVVANRLSEIDANVLVLEAGGCPPFESTLPGYITTLPLSQYDYAYTPVNDGYTCQNQKQQGSITAGKMFGGSGGLNHMIYVPPFKSDYDHWSRAANDESWAFPEFEKYFKKAENVLDEGVLAQNSHLHGTNGPLKVSKQESPLTLSLIRAHEELGIQYLNDTYGVCSSDPLLTIGNGFRQSGNVGYLSILTKSENKVKFLSGAVATKIIFEGTTATGVQYIFKNKTYTATVTKQVIVSAGAIKSPQLLMVSGIGDKDTLASFGIESIVQNNQVGKNLMDHLAAVAGFSLDENTKPAVAANPYEFPVPTITAYDALNKSLSDPEIQNIALYFGPNSTGLLQICTYVFKYLDTICDAWYKGNTNRNFVLNVLNLMNPKSTGSIGLKSADVNDEPIINLALLSNSDDLEEFAQLLLQYVEPLLKTSTLKSLGAKFIDLGLCKTKDISSLEFWKCYIVKMSSTMWNYSGTCQIGKVVDNNLTVIGTTNVKVVDASVAPHMKIGNIESEVIAMAEKASDIIKVEGGYFSYI